MGQNNQGARHRVLKSKDQGKALKIISCSIKKLRMYCIDRVGVPESHDAHAFYCLYD